MTQTKKNLTHRTDSCPVGVSCLKPAPHSSNLVFLFMKKKKKKRFVITHTRHKGLTERLVWMQPLNKKISTGGKKDILLWNKNQNDSICRQTEQHAGLFVSHVSSHKQPRQTMNHSEWRQKKYPAVVLWVFSTDYAYFFVVFNHLPSSVCTAALCITLFSNCGFFIKPVQCERGE